MCAACVYMCVCVSMYMHLYLYMYMGTNFFRELETTANLVQVPSRFQAGFKLALKWEAWFQARFQALKPTLLQASGFKPGFKPVLKTQTPKQRDLAARPARGKRGAPLLTLSLSISVWPKLAEATPNL